MENGLWYMDDNIFVTDMMIIYGTDCSYILGHKICLHSMYQGVSTYLAQNDYIYGWLCTQPKIFAP